MKKLLTFVTTLFLVFTLCGCALSQNTIKENLTKAGYEISDISSQQLETLNNDIKYVYKGSGSIISGFYASDKFENNITVLEFANKDDLTVMYKEIKATLNEGQTIDLSGNIIVYGYENGVKVALD